MAAEGRRVTSGAASGDVLKLERLTKVYRGAGIAVDRLCVGVAKGEVRTGRFNGYGGTRWTVCAVIPLYTCCLSVGRASALLLLVLPPGVEC